MGLVTHRHVSTVMPCRSAKAPKSVVMELNHLPVAFQTTALPVS